MIEMKIRITAVFLMMLLVCSCSTDVQTGRIRKEEFSNGYTIWRSEPTWYYDYVYEMKSDGKERLFQIISEAEFYREMDSKSDRLPKLSGDESTTKKPMYAVWIIGDNIGYRIDNWPKLRKAPGPSWENLPIFQEKMTQTNVLWIWEVDFSEAESWEEKTKLLRMADMEKIMESEQSVGWYSLISDEDEYELHSLLLYEEFGERQKLGPGF